MSYKYYSIMRPVGIGTYPGKPESIHNYDGRQTVITADGSKINAWGELTYKSPLTEEDILRYELRGESEYPSYRHVGYWMGNNTLEIIKLGNKYYCLNGWNGESYTSCWECLTTTKMADTDVEYTLTPVYYYETNAGIALQNDMADMDEDSEDWQKNVKKLNQIISYSVKKN